MSSPRIAALVCEGQTDVPILRAAIQAVWPEVEEVRCLQPELDETDRARGPAGWTQVRTWCERHSGPALNDVLDPDIGNPIDLLLVAIDVDIAIEAGIADPPKHVGAYETTRLRRKVSGWLFGTGPQKREVIISTPVMAIESWIIAALFSQQSRPENISDPAEWLVNKKKLQRSPGDGRPWKELHRYNDFARSVASRISRVRGRCPEANRTLSAVERRSKEK